IPRKPLPTIAEAIEGKQRIIAERVLEIIEQGELTEYKGLAIQLLEQYDSVQLLAAGMKILTGDKKVGSDIHLTPEDPIRAKRRKPDIRNGRKPSGGYGGRSSGGGYRRDGGSGSGSGGNRGGYSKG
ncbi:DEAD/DEAH box helicase, partial [Clostridium perfringens]